MYNVLLATAHPQTLAELAAGLEEDGRARLYWAKDDQEALSLTQELAPQLVIIEGLGREKETLAWCPSC